MSSEAATLSDPVAGQVGAEGRNLVVCLDGTDNQFCATNTNVVRLFQSLDRDPAKQLAYYDPGVGTIWEPGTLSRTSQKLQMLLGLAFGLGVTSNVEQAYGFLMRYYQPHDRVFIFGFSRGALEARALAGLLYRCGLLHPQQNSLGRYATQLFQTPGDYEVVHEFKSTFSRDVEVAFLGLWDTVTSMGNVWSPIHWPYTTTNPSVRSVAHAIAIDERRAFFRQNRWGRSQGQLFSEVWFPGVHSDVGGGYDPASGRLWAITLRWMVAHAQRARLSIDQARLDRALADGGAESATLPDYATAQHDSLTAAWKPLELVPKRRRERNADGTWTAHWLIPAREAGFRGRPRMLKPGEAVHRSAIERFVALGSYRPETLVKAGLTEDVARRFLETPDDQWIVPGRA